MNWYVVSGDTNPEPDDVHLIILIRPNTDSYAALRMPRWSWALFDLNSDHDVLMERLINWIPATDDWTIYELQVVSRRHYMTNYQGEWA